MQRFLIVNPRSGTESPDSDELAEAARERGIQVHLLQPDDDVHELVRASGADTVGMAGGDGSLAAVAEVALAQDLAFVVVPYGTRNHFARDLGLERDDVLGALGAFDAGVERRVDVGRVGDRLFLNNVSLGIYARLVHRRERHRRRREALARLRALGLTLRDRRRRQRFTIDGEEVRARLVLISNNAYALDLLSLGERERLDEGLLHLYVPHGIRRITWEERACAELEVGSPLPRLRAAIDGEPAELDAPVRFRIEPQALRVLVPPGAAAREVR
ncbi:MAG: diacylglycerol/lipid kinase family protein [Gaiellaceae bacterium]